MKKGFTIAEMLVALAVMAILLTAVAVAFNASATNYNENDEMFKAINAGRQAMIRMTNQLRTAKAVELPTNEANTRCSFVTADDADIRFCYHSFAKMLYLHPLSGNTVTASHVMCRNVTEMTFNRTMGVDSYGNSYVKSVQMSMTVTVGNQSQTITGAAVLRKTL